VSGPARAAGLVVGALVALGLAGWLGWVAVPELSRSEESSRQGGAALQQGVQVPDAGGEADQDGIGSARRPVLLVPGWLDTERDLAVMRIRLLSAGWSPDAVEAIGFAEPTGSSRAHARELADAVDGLLERTGADRVDIVAHSMGGLATRWYLLTEPDAPVRGVAFLASPHRGTVSAHLAWGDGRDEMMPDSPFLDSLNTFAPTPLGVDVITIRTSVDTHIVPGESATLPGAPDYRICCPTHAGLLRDEEAFSIVLEFLLRDDPEREGRSPAEAR
jgi:triacylglycerol lipase